MHSRGVFDPEHARQMGLPVVDVWQPGSVEEVADCVHRARRQQVAIYPVGGGTLLAFGQPSTRPGILLDMSRLQQTVEYPARDLTITMQVGVTAGGLEQILQQEGQTLPVDIPRADQATLGGAVACNLSGPRRLGFGTLRDYLIGIQYVNDRGDVCKAGGRVVKNVAGYDLCKLFIGSLGALGILTALTFKVRPLPGDSALVLVHCPDGHLPILLDVLSRSATQPTALEVLDAQATARLHALAGWRPQQLHWLVVIGYQEHARNVAWQLEQVAKELQSHPVALVHRSLGPDSQPLWRALADGLYCVVPQWTDSEQADGRWILVRASAPPSRMAELCRYARGRDWAVQAHAGSGIMLAALDASDSDRCVASVNELRQVTAQAGGAAAVVSCPASLRPQCPWWDPARPEVSLMARIKRAFDPTGIFNPGRFVEGL